MVVEAGVLLVHPADQPRRDVVVAQQLRVAARGAVVLDEVRPQLRALGEALDELDQLGRVHAGTSTPSAPLRVHRGQGVLAPRRRAARGAAAAMTGRSEPCTRRSTPTSRSIESRVRAPYDELSNQTSGSWMASAGPPRAASRSACSGAEPGEHGEHHAQPRMPRAAERRQRVPGRAHLRDVVGHRRPPAAAPSAASWPGRDGRTAARRAPRGGRAGPPRARPRAREGGGSVIPRAPASSSASTSVRRVERGAPQLERRAELEDAVVERVDQRPRLVGRERLDPERGGERDDDAVDALALGLGGARDGIVVAFVQRAVRLAGELEAQRGDRSPPPAEPPNAAPARRSAASGRRCWWRSVRIGPDILEQSLRT